MMLSAGVKKLHAQNCNLYFPSKEGTEMEITNYDAKGKVTGTVKEKILKKETIANGIAVTFESRTFNKKGDSTARNQFQVKCENGVFYFDMNDFIPPSQNQSGKNSMEIKADKLDFPSNPEVGKTLSDGTVTMTMKNGDIQLMSMSITLSNRKIEAIESVTTPAGSFECYKISYHVTTDMMFKTESTGIEWVAKNVGMVKSENYDKSGKLNGSSLLTSLKN